MKQLNYLFLPALLLLLSCSGTKQESKTAADYRNAETETLYIKLKALADSGKIMFGCANPTTLMYKEKHIWEGFNNSDSKEITGQHPAYYESDFMWHGDDPKLRTADLEAMKKAYERGAVTGYCWHIRGMESNSFYAQRNGINTADSLLVKKIVKGGTRDDNPELNWFYTQLDSVVIPVFKELGFATTFRPWHEMNGGWFWWGSATCTPEEYVQLYRLTVDYLRNSGVDNLLYVWSPDTRLTMEYYPGDDYVDILGLDIYEMGAIHYKPMELVTGELEKLVAYAESHDKVAAITETGLRMQDGIFRYPEEIPDYWSNYVLRPLVTNPKLKGIVWVESWYSADWSGQGQSQFYYPYRGIENDFPNGQAAIDDFLKFYEHPATLFEDDLPEMYQ
ncbi:glycoside hydrolase family 26 protein [Roseimarinus sediminis]|uniref:glycoside hydrolase family 26 protein n=1 Tax=Roseimarinus sediminis TaxID=1610899 RepID=UPI003D25CF15